MQEQAIGMPTVKRCFGWIDLCRYSRHYGMFSSRTSCTDSLSRRLRRARSGSLYQESRPDVWQNYQNHVRTACQCDRVLAPRPEGAAPPGGSPCAPGRAGPASLVNVPRAHLPVLIFPLSSTRLPRPQLRTASAGRRQRATEKRFRKAPAGPERAALRSGDPPSACSAFRAMFLMRHRIDVMKHAVSRLRQPRTDTPRND